MGCILTQTANEQGKLGLRGIHVYNPVVQAEITGGQKLQQQLLLIDS